GCAPRCPGARTPCAGEDGRNREKWRSTWRESLATNSRAHVRGNGNTHCGQNESDFQEVQKLPCGDRYKPCWSSIIATRRDPRRRRSRRNAGWKIRREQIPVVLFVKRLQVVGLLTKLPARAEFVGQEHGCATRRPG